MQFVDSIVLDGVRRTNDGYLVATSRVARTGIQTYLGREVDPENKLGLRDRATVSVFRPEDEVFSRDALNSFAHRPITIGHPDAPVNSGSWKDVARGQTGGEVMRDGDFVQVPLVLMDAAAIRTYEAGTRELSMGYAAELVVQDGVAPDGQKYDAVMKNLRMNHLAIVPMARGGDKLRIGDSGKDRPMLAIMLDGLTVNLEDRDAQIVQRTVDRLTKQVTDANTALADAAAAHQAEIAKRDKDAATKDAELDALKAKVLDAGALDAAVVARGDLIAKAKAIVPTVVTDGKADADIRLAVVTAKLGDAVVAGKSADYVNARFDMLAEDAAANGKLHRALGDAGGRTNLGDGAAAEEAARLASLKRFDRSKKDAA